MNKKILAIFTLLIVAVSISAVSAFDLGDIFGDSDENKTITIDGIKFNVPDGYQNDTDEIQNEITKQLKNVGFKVNTEAFVKDSHAIIIGVANYNNTGMSDEEVANTFLDETPTTIKNINGSSNSDNGTYVFSYQKDGRLIVMSTDDKEIVSDFLIA